MWTAHQESVSVICGLQNTTQGCLTALKLSRIYTEDWDCLFVYMCSS